MKTQSNNKAMKRSWDAMVMRWNKGLRSPQSPMKTINLNTKGLVSCQGFFTKDVKILVNIRGYKAEKEMTFSEFLGILLHEKIHEQFRIHPPVYPARNII